MGSGGLPRINGQLIALLGFVLFCLTVTFVITALLPRLVPKERNCEDHNVDADSLELAGLLPGSRLRIRLDIGNTAKRPGKYFHCAAKNEYVRPQPRGSNVTCKEYQWRLSHFTPTVTDCVDLSGQFWFGGSTMWRQDWPLNTAQQDRAAYVPGDIYKRQYGGVMERYWISTGGFSVFVNDRVPLQVELNGSRLCLTGSRQEEVGAGAAAYNLTAMYSNESLLAYTVCKGPDIRSLYRATKFWESPTQMPDRSLFSKPIWSTWAYLKSNITQESVHQFATNISTLGLPATQLEIDDKWSTNYGDHAFDLTRFPNPAQLVDSVHRFNYNVTLWVHPFANRGTDAFAAGLAAAKLGASFLVASGDNSSEPGLTSWWRSEANASAALIDVTDPNGEGTRHLKASLQKLRSDFGVDSFKLDAGEANWLPAKARLRGYQDQPNPGWYGHAWASLGHQLDLDRRRQEVRVGFRAQHLPLLVRAMDKDSHWGLDNGLKAMVTSALTQCLIGYSFHLPDMVGGNAYCEGPDGLDGRCYPDQELYIRWLQAAVFMPTVQLSVPPWVYGQEVVNIAKSLLATREEQRFRDNMDAGLKSVLTDGDPLVRPMWWVEGGKADIADQFMLGESILVAPIMTKGETGRRVAFPNGRWRYWFDNSTADVVGPTDVFVLMGPLLSGNPPAFWRVG